METSPEETTRLNNELLKIAKPVQEEETEVKKPKRNSSSELLKT